MSRKHDGLDAHDWALRLEEIGSGVKNLLLKARKSGVELTTAVAHEGGDTIFAIDRHVEPVIHKIIEGWDQRDEPILLVMEGLGETGERRYGDANAPLKYRLIIDPIDGTRNIMYDKRSAWFLAAIAEDRGSDTRLSHAFASVMIELPTSLQSYYRRFLAVRGEGVVAQTIPPHAEFGITDPGVGPSRATTLMHGFAQVTNFFPGTKVLASELMEAIASATIGGDSLPGAATIFDDQYMTTGGQMIELALGHDRFCCDLRPLFYDVLARQQGKRFRGRGLECHPYDCGGMLVAQEAGVILTDGFGRPLDAPMDVHTGVHWCGYANESLREQIEPVVRRFFHERGVAAP